MLHAYTLLEGRDAQFIRALRAQNFYNGSQSVGPPCLYKKGGIDKNSSAWANMISHFSSPLARARS